MPAAHSMLRQPERLPEPALNPHTQPRWSTRRGHGRLPWASSADWLVRSGHRWPRSSCLRPSPVPAPRRGSSWDAGLRRTRTLDTFGISPPW